jgi:hypothetical protein
VIVPSQEQLRRRWDMASRRTVFLASLILLCLSVTAYAEEKFPWQVSMDKYGKLSPEQQQIYLDSFFESMFFIMYGMTDPANSEALQQINGWIDCILESRETGTWSADLSWSLAEEKSAAYVLYTKVSPIICKGFEKKAGTSRRLLKIYSPEDWESWPRKTRKVYLAGFLDTIATFEMRMKENGMQNDLRGLKVLIEAIGIDGILSVAITIKSDKKSPLPWLMAESLGTVRKKLKP